jgi:hypothetical protein
MIKLWTENIYLWHRYSNSFVTMLNNRHSSGGGGPDGSTSSGTDDFSMDRSLPRNQTHQLKNFRTPQVAVAIHRETRMDDISDIPKSHFDDDTLPKRRLSSDILVPDIGA